MLTQSGLSPPPEHAPEPVVFAEFPTDGFYRHAFADGSSDAAATYFAPVLIYV